MQAHFHAEAARLAQSAWSAARSSPPPERSVHPLLRVSVDGDRGTHEDYLRFLVSSWIAPNETIEQMGIASTREADLVLASGQPMETPAVVFVAGTARELFLIRTSRSSDGMRARRLCLGVTALPLAQIHVGPSSGGPALVSFALDSATTITLDLSTPHPEMPSDATFRAGFASWLASRASSAPPPPAPGPGPTRRSAEMRMVHPFAKMLSAYSEKREAEGKGAVLPGPGGTAATAGLGSKRMLAIGCAGVLGLTSLCCLWQFVSPLLFAGAGSSGPEASIGFAGVGAAALQARVCDGGHLEGAGEVTSNPTLLVFTRAAGGTPTLAVPLSDPAPFSIATFTYAVCMDGPTMVPVARPRPGCTELPAWQVRVVRAATGAVVASGSMQARSNAQCSDETPGDFDGVLTDEDVHAWVLAHAPH